MINRSDLPYRVMSSRAFFPIVKAAVVNRRPLSCVRFGDGEKWLFDNAPRGPEILTRVGYEDWLEPLGITGIPGEVLQERLQVAAIECDFFAPSVTGLYREDYNLYDIFPERPVYIDNFFVNDWTDIMKEELIRAAGHVLVIHHNTTTADSMQLRVQANLDTKVSFIKLSNWTQTDYVIRKAANINAPLVLFSGGPAGKYIGHRISRGGHIPKVALDIGNGMDHWTMDHLPADRAKANAFHIKWKKGQSC
jgi:hypothetical protein